jgi:adenylate cyclase
MKIRDGLAACVFAALFSVILALPQADRLDALSIDVLHYLRHNLFAAPIMTDSDTAVVIAVDEETYRTEPFSGSPKVSWTPQLADVLSAVTDAGAAVTGFDLIYPTSMETFVRGYDRSFLLALRRATGSDSVVLGKVQHSDAPIAPHQGQSYAVGHAKNIRAVNVIEDEDGIIRRVPYHFDAQNKDGSIRREIAFAVELAARTLKKQGRETQNIFMGESMAGSRGNALTLNFNTSSNAIPTWSFADLYACAKSGNKAFFRKHFAGRPVLFGVVLDVEDRKLTSARLVKPVYSNHPPARCVSPGQPVALPERDSLPGVYIHATAVNNILQGNGLTEFGRTTLLVMTLPLVLMGALLAFARHPILGGSGIVGGLCIWTGVAAYGFTHSYVLPLLDPLGASIFAWFAMLGYRFLVADRDKIFLRKAFAFYLAPDVIAHMVDQETPPTLGGESREVTVLFSDVASFTAISERLSPTELVRFMNIYLSAMTDIIEEYGGFVDKYIGDAIVAVFGAPMDDPDHARKAVAAALDCRDKLAAMQDEFGLPDDIHVTARIGLNTGMTLVGNIGSQRRFNYTVMGDTVNLAARLESINKVYGTSILVSAETADACGSSVDFREVDHVRVMGKARPVVMLEPLGPSVTINSKLVKVGLEYSQAIAAYRLKDFPRAISIFDKLAIQGDGPSKLLAKRSRDYVLDPPRDTWQGVTDLDQK